MVDASLGFFCAGCHALLEQWCGVCPSCFEAGLVFRRYRRLAASDGPSEISATDLLRQRRGHFRVPSLPGLVLGAGALLLMEGPAGGGKSTALARLMGDLRPSLFVSLEMGTGPQLADLVGRQELLGDDLRFCEARTQADLLAVVARGGLRGLAIDSLSVSSLLPDDCRRLCRTHRYLLAGSLQVNKEGAAAGPAGWAHAGDVVLRVDGGRWRLTKSRFQPVVPALGGVLWSSARGVTASCA